MIKSHRNQLGNAKNPHQGDRKRVLCVCSAGLLRSPTIATYLSERYEFNTRACGTSDEYELIPISEALLHWADEIHCVLSEAQHVRLLLSSEMLTTPVFAVDIPDDYDAFSVQLISEITNEYSRYESWVSDK